MAPGLTEQSPKQTQTTAVQAALDAAILRFTVANPLSLQQHALSATVLPGGNTRTLLHTSPFPLALARGRDTTVWDVDGHAYTDLVGELTAGLYGHSHPAVRAAILRVLDDVGLSLGGQTALEQQFAARLCARFRLARVRMANSGTEASLHALAAARAFTGRCRVLVFAGGYHGAVLSFAGGVPAPNNVDRQDFVVAGCYNDPDAVTQAIQQHQQQHQQQQQQDAAAAGQDDDAGLAAVLVEPMLGAGGCIPASRAFLLAAQQAAHRAGALFLLDEVMTSRLAPGGLAAALDLRPDLVVLGKYLGGGLAFGAFGGREEVMAVYDPRRRSSALAHSGTFNNNTLAMAAGRAALEEAYGPAACEAHNARGDELRSRLNAVCRGSRACFTGRGSMMAVHFVDDGREELRAADEVAERTDLRDLFWYEMLEEGFWVLQRGMIALMLDTPQEELDRLVEAVGRFVERHREILTVEKRETET